MEMRDLLEYEIYPKIDRAEALRDLNPQDKGSNFLLTCPECGKREAFIYKEGKPYIKCNRENNCSYGASLWDYIREKEGLSQGDTLKRLAQLAGIELPRGEFSTKDIEERNKKGNALEKLLEKAQEELKNSKEAIAYLKRRAI